MSSTVSYADFVEAKVYKPLTNAVTSSLEKRIEKLEEENMQMDVFIKDIYKQVQEIKFNNKENLPTNILPNYKQQTTFEIRIDRIEKKINENMLSNLPVKQPLSDKIYPYDSCSKLNSQRTDEIFNMEKRIEKTLKNQAEDISVDVVELEKQIRAIDIKATLMKKECVTHRELNKFEQFFIEKMDTILSEAKDIINCKFPTPNIQINPSKHSTEPSPNHSKPTVTTSEIDTSRYKPNYKSEIRT
jgi:hypothetical protein